MIEVNERLGYRRVSRQLEFQKRRSSEAGSPA